MYENHNALYYSSFVALGLIAGLITLKLLKYPKQVNGIKTSEIMPIVVIGAIVGAKIPLVLSYGWSIPVLMGKSYFGALLGGFLTLNIYKYFRKMKGGMGDRFVVPLCVGAGFGKIGCYFFGCCSGTPTDFFLKIQNVKGVYVHPVQVYEVLFEFLMAGLFIHFHKKNIFKGQQFLLYMTSYMIFRFLIEFIRIEPKVMYGLSVYQVMSIIFVPIFLKMIIKRKIENV